MDFLLEFVLFLAKTVVIFGALLILIIVILRSVKIIVESVNNRNEDDFNLTIENITEKQKAEKEMLSSVLIAGDDEENKAFQKLNEKMKKKEALEKKKAAQEKYEKALKELKLEDENSQDEVDEKTSQTQEESQSNENAENTENKEEQPVKAKPNDKLHEVMSFEKKCLFVVDFNGSVDAAEVAQLRRAITLVLGVAESTDEVLIRLTSPGGTVNGYGLCAAELERLKAKNIKLTVAVDEVAASGGYLMGCVADKIIAAPFAYVGSIGVVTEFPNFNRLLHKYDIDYEQVTAGEFKRTMTTFGENTEEARQHVKEELARIHDAFKNHVKKYRPNIDIEKVANGEHWLASEAINLGLVDELKTSDQYIQEKAEEVDSVLLIAYKEKKRRSLRDIVQGNALLRNVAAFFVKKLKNILP